MASTALLLAATVKALRKRALVWGLVLATAPSTIGQAGDLEFRARVSACTADGRYVGEQVLTCPGSPACSFHIEMPFRDELWSMSVRIKQVWPGTFNAWIVGSPSPLGSWGRPSGFREFSLNTDSTVELEARWIDHRIKGSPIDSSILVARFEIEVL
jgi:hypothetical protein